MRHTIEVDGLNGGMLMLTFSEDDIREQVQINRSVIDIIKRVFIELMTKVVVMPSIMRLDISAHHGKMDVKTAYIPGYDMFALKVSTDFFDNKNWDFRVQAR